MKTKNFIEIDKYINNIKNIDIHKKYAIENELLKNYNKENYCGFKCINNIKNIINLITIKNDKNELYNIINEKRI